MQRELNSLMQKAKANYDRKRKELDDEYQKNIEAIKRVVFLIGDNNNLQALATAGIDAQDGHESGSEMVMQKADADTVREIVDSFIEDYTVNDVRGKAAGLNPPLEVSRNVFYHVLKQKKEAGEAKMIKEGSGRMPAVYRNVDKEAKLEMVPR